MRLFGLLALALFAAPLAARAAMPEAAKGDVQQPVYMSAQQLGYDKTNAIVVAQGKVQVVQGDYVLFADRIAYYQDRNIVRAQGNITLLEPDGNVLFADELRLKDDLKVGVIDSFRVRMADNSLFAAREAKKLSENTYALRQAVYSPCKLCKDEETGEVKDPLWQLKAEDVQIDQAKERVVYHDAWMELYGVPIAYTPYFSHPTPGAKRKSGILAPAYSQNQQLGTTLQIPVYLNIAPNIDATITPFLTSEEGPVMIGQYRHLTEGGYFQMDGSITNPQQRDEFGQPVPGQNEIRGHIFATGNSQISDHWSWGFDVNRTTDDTYLRRYRFGNQNMLRSRLFSERIEDRDYVVVESMAFQGLQATSDPDTSPFVLPAAKIYTESDPLVLGSRLRMEASGRTVMRDIGADSRRASLDTGWRVPLLSSGGHMFETDASVRADLYSVSDFALASGGAFDGTETRAIPRLATGWRYPVMQMLGSDTLTLEPMAQLVATSNGNNPDSIPNEDSLVPEFSDINLFSYNRFAGYDRIENGVRAVYGMRGEYREAEGRSYNAMLGQDVMVRGDRLFPVSEAPEDQSDYVGKLGLNGVTYDVDYRFRVDPDDMTLRRSELLGLLELDSVVLLADYVIIKDDPILLDRNEGLFSGTLPLTDNWSVNTYARRDFDLNELRATGGGLTYKNDCLTVVSRFDREFTQDRDFRPDTLFMVQVFLKNLN
jgi:LPS-assembly protein